MAIQEDKRRAVAVCALLLTTMLWSTSFITVKRCGAILSASTPAGTSRAFGPLLLTALRFTVAVPLLVLVWGGARRWRPRRADLAPLLRVGLPMAAGFLTQAAGMAWTTATISAFLTSLVVCLTPAAEVLLLRRRIGWRLGLAVLLAVAGVALMTLTRGGGKTFGPGEMLTLACAAAFALQVLWTNEAAECVGPAGLTVGTFVMVAAAAWLGVLAAWGRHVPGALRAAATNGEFAWMFAVIVLCATLGAMVLMNAFQRYVRPSEAAVIYTSEPVFAAIFAYALAGSREALSRWGLSGAGLLLVADLVAGVRRRRRRAALVRSARST